MGGFSANEYLFQRIKKRFISSIPSIIRPANGDIASCRGGARRSLSPIVSSVIQSQSIFRRDTFPAEPEDYKMRPVYIQKIKGKSVCENRVEYIFKKGERLAKGSRSKVKLRKLCSTRSDSVFELVLYASSGDRIIRYFDEEKSDVLCRCRMDLETYPGFQQRAEASLGGFYIDFVLGVEMDTAEIRCMLLYEGEIRGSVTCHTRIQ